MLGLRRLMVAVCFMLLSGWLSPCLLASALPAKGEDAKKRAAIAEALVEVENAKEKADEGLRQELEAVAEQLKQAKESLDTNVVRTAQALLEHLSKIAKGAAKRAIERARETLNEEFGEFPPPIQPGVRARVETTPGLETVVFDTPQGRVSVNFPSDIRARDRISGTVNLEPAGRTQEEQERNRGTLRGYVVEIEEQKAPVNDPWWSWTVPPGVDGWIDVVLVPEGGPPIVHSRVPVPSGPTSEPPPGFELPPIGQTGRPIVISGPFDGRLDTGRVTVGGVDAPPVAQSPRVAVFTSPTDDVVGPVEIRLEEGTQTASGPFRNVAIDLSAPRLDLDRGQSTTLTARVSGLAKLDHKISFELVNASPSVVELSGGNVQTVVITPEEVGEDGVYTWHRPLTGVRVGGFDIRADLELPGVVLQATDNEIPAAENGGKTACRCESFEVKLAGDSPDLKLEDITAADGSGTLTLTAPLFYKIKCTQGEADAKCTGAGEAQSSAEVTVKKEGSVVKHQSGVTELDAWAFCGRELTHDVNHVQAVAYEKGKQPLRLTFRISASVKTGCPAKNQPLIVLQVTKKKGKLVLDQESSDWDGDGIPNKDEKKGEEYVPNKKK